MDMLPTVMLPPDTMSSPSEGATAAAAESAAAAPTAALAALSLHAAADQPDVAAPATAAKAVTVASVTSSAAGSAAPSTAAVMTAVAAGPSVPPVAVTCSGSCSARPTAKATAGTSVSVADLPAFEAVLDIEDMRTVWICGVPRPRPPIVPFLCPFRVHLEPGKVYRYCTCGRSESQPWCDDEHGDTDPQPIEFSVDVNQSWHLICGCKYSTSPFCDGSHIHAVDGYEEESTVPKAAAVPAAANANASSTSAASDTAANDSASR